MAATVSMAHMVDLALGTPEVGAVNFNVLHALLHAMLSKLDLAAATAVLSKEDSDLLTLADSGVGTASVGEGGEVKDGTTKDGKDGNKTDAIGIAATQQSPSRSPYHVLQKKVAKLEEQMEKLNELPSNPDLFERSKPVGDGESQRRPVSAMWKNVQLKNRVDANEEGIGKLMSLVQDLMSEMAKVKDDSDNLRKDLDNHNIPELRSDVEDLKKKLEDLTNKMNDMTDLDELRKRLKDLEKLTNDMNDTLSAYPPIERFDDFVTWHGLEEALKGIRDELEPKERVVIEMQTQTSRPSSLPSSNAITSTSDLIPSSPVPTMPSKIQSSPAMAPPSPGTTPPSPAMTPPSPAMSRPVSAARNGPSKELQEMLEKLGILSNKHEALDGRVVKLEEEMPNKADKADLLGLAPGPADIPDDLVNQLKHLQDQLKTLSKAREKLSELEEKLSQLPDFAGMEEIIDGLNIGQGDLQRMIESLRKEYEASMSSLEDKISSLQDLAMNPVEVPEPPPRTPTPELKLPPIPGASPPPDHSGKLSELERALSKKESEMKALQQKMKWLMQDTNKQVTDLKDRLKNVDKELQNLISQREKSPKKPTSPIRTKSSDMGIISSLSASNAITFISNMTQTSVPSMTSISMRPLSPPKPLPPITPTVPKTDDQDSEALSRMQQIVLQLQAELDRLSNTAQRLIDDNNNKTKQIDNLINTSDKLDKIKADKEYVQTEVDVKADKRLVENKVNRSLFDQTTDELNKLIRELLDKLSGHEESWKNAIGTINEDVDGKLDRLEFGPIRDELERRLRALARQLKELSLRDGDLEDDAAGIRKQLLRFHCISCDRPVDMTQQGPIPSIPAPGGLPPTRSSRPYTTFELEQIRQHARNSFKKGLRNASNFERAVLERQMARYRMKNGVLTFTSESINYEIPRKTVVDCGEGINLQQPGVEVVDLYATSRACGGNHTMTHPHRRITRVTQYNNLFREEELAPTTKEELDIQGADGHIYKGRIDARLPTTLKQSAPNITAPQPSNQAPKMSRVIYNQGGMPRPPQTAPVVNQQSAGVAPRPNSARTIKPLPTSVPTAEGLERQPPSPPNSTN